MSLRFEIYRFWLLCFVLVTEIHRSFPDIPQESELEEFIICRQCGADIADSNYIVDHLSPELLNSLNRTLFGKPDVTIQTLVNPFGIKFRIINTSKALCASVGEWHGADSWYPGFAWRACVCPQCGRHLGWLFEPIESANRLREKPTDRGFYGLIVDSLLSERFTNSLLISPSS